MAMPWFRMYTEARTDRKLASLTDQQFRVWFNMICLAGEFRERGTVDTSDPFLLAIEVANGDTELLNDVISMLSRLQILTVDETSITFTHWVERQYDKESDTPEKVNERVKRHRDTVKRDVTPMKRDETRSNALYTDTEEDNNPHPAIAGDAVSLSADFEAFWAVYPKKVGKQDAIKAWKTTKKTRPAIDKIIVSVSQQTQSTQWQKDGGQFIPNPATWLRAGRWDDVPVQPSQPQPTPFALKPYHPEVEKLEHSLVTCKHMAKDGDPVWVEKLAKCEAMLAEARKKAETHHDI